MRGDIALFMGLVAIIGGGIVAAFVFIFGGSGGDGGGNILCDEPLDPQGQSDISQIGFQAEDDGLTSVIQAASAENLEAVTEVWHADDSELHDFTHNVDQLLLEADEELAEELCEAVNGLEDELSINRRPDRVALQATRIRELLRDAAEALGYPRPGG